MLVECDVVGLLQLVEALLFLILLGLLPSVLVFPPSFVLLELLGVDLSLQFFEFLYRV